MAQEIRATAGITLQNGNLQVSRSVSNFPADQSGVGLQYGVQHVPTSPTALDMGNIGTAGWAFFRNLDSTNFIQIGTTGFVPFVTLLPGEVAVMRLATSAPYAQSDTAAVDLEYLILEA